MLKTKALGFLAIILLYIGFVGMCLTIYQYLSFSRTTGFLAFKQAVVSNSFWRTAFYLHVFTCFLCLTAGFTQFSSLIQKKYITIHRAVGKMYVYNILIVNFPMALILGIYANGNLPGKIAFILLDLLWVYFTFAAIYWVKNGNIPRHRNFMIRSYALTLTALTLRLCKFVLSRYSDWTYESIYIFDAWTALSFNLVVAELIIWRKNYRWNRKLTTIR